MRGQRGSAGLLLSRTCSLLGGRESLPLVENSVGHANESWKRRRAGSEPQQRRSIARWVVEAAHSYNLIRAQPQTLASERVRILGTYPPRLPRERRTRDRRTSIGSCRLVYYMVLAGILNDLCIVLTSLFAVRH